jgi:hypothetical protein
MVAYPLKYDSILILVRDASDETALIHVAICMPQTPWQYGLVCDASKEGMKTVSHRKGNVPTCLQCIATLQIRYFTE